MLCIRMPNCDVTQDVLVMRCHSQRWIWSIIDMSCHDLRLVVTRALTLFGTAVAQDQVSSACIRRIKSGRERKLPMKKHQLWPWPSLNTLAIASRQFTPQALRAVSSSSGYNAGDVVMRVTFDERSRRSGESRGPP